MAMVVSFHTSFDQGSGCIIHLHGVHLASGDKFGDVVVESHWSNVSSSVHAVLLLNTGLERISGVMSALITPSEHHILTPTIVHTHHTCTYGSEQRHHHHQQEQQ